MSITVLLNYFLLFAEKLTCPLLVLKSSSYRQFYFYFLQKKNIFLV